MNASMVTAARLMEMDALAEHVPPEILSERLLEMAREQAGLGEADVQRLRMRLAASAEPDPAPQAWEFETETASLAKKPLRDHLEDRATSLDLEIGESAQKASVGSPALEPKKECTRCKNAKPLDAFNVNEYTGDGRDARCVECLREIDLKREEKAEAAEANPGDKVGSASGLAEADAGRKKPEGLKKLAFKHCERREKKKPLSSFEENPNTADGHTNACSACLRQLNSNREYYKEAGL